MTYFPETRGIESSLNSTSTALNDGEIFVGTGEKNTFSDVLIAAKTDQPGVVYAEFSVDGSNWDSSLAFQVKENFNEIHKLMKGTRYFRVRFLNNSGSNQTFLRLSVSYGNFGSVLTSPLNSVIASDADAIVTRSISEEIAIAEGKYDGRLVVNKFGRNNDVDGVEDIWDGGGTYTGFPTSTLETVSVVSSSSNDSSAGTGARTVRIFGLDTDFNLQQEDITMNGVTPVASVNTYRRVYRVYTLTAGTVGTSDGNITVRHTTTTANVFCVIPAGFGQSEISAYTIPAGYTGYLKNYSAGMLDSNANSCIIGLWIRPYQSAFTIVRPFTISTTFNFSSNVYGGIKLEEKTDVVFRVLSVANTNADITARYDLILVKNIS